MKPERRHRIKGVGRVLVDLYACFLIPSYTLLFAGGERWLDTNFSVLSLLGVGQFWGFVLWGMLVAGYYLVLMVLICRSLKRRRVVGTLTVLACLALGGALLLPYAPRFLPGVAQAHIVLAFSACVLLMLALLLVLLRCRYWDLLWSWLAVAVVCAILFAAAGKVSSALEIWFVITTALLVRALWLRRTAAGDIL